MFFGKAETDKLREYAAERGVTIFQLFLAAYALLLSKLYGGGSVTIGVPFSGREHPNTWRTVGMLVKTLPLRLDISGTSLHNAVEHTRERFAGAWEHQGVSIARLTELIDRARTASGNAFYDVMLNYVPLPQPIPDNSGLAPEILRGEYSGALFDIILDVQEETDGFCSLGDIFGGIMPHILSIEPPPSEKYHLVSSNAELITDFDAVFTLGNEIRCEFAYNARAYTEEAVEAVRGYFLTALNAVLENPQINMESIPILTDTEISKLTALDENRELLRIIDSKTVTDLFHESAVAHANITALVCGDVRLTYTEVSNTADRLCAGLKSRGISSETPVAILLPRSEKYVITELAVMQSSGMFIPLDTDWPAGRIETILAETTPALLIDENTYAELLSGVFKPDSDGFPSPTGASYMIMTSGTSGTPKGVVVPHRALTHYCLWAKERYGWRPGDISALELGFAFDGSMWSIFPPLISGGTLHVLTDDIRFDLSAVGGYCRRERVTHLDLPVSMANAFREIYRGDNTLSDLRVMVTGGEQVRSVADAPYPLSNEYGPTECTVCCSASWLDGTQSEIIENVLRSHPAVSTAAVGAAGEKLCAYVVLREGSDLSELDGFISSKLPGFMRPVLELVDIIPMTSSGKVDFGILSLSKTEKTAKVLAPVTENEKLLLSEVTQL